MNNRGFSLVEAVGAMLILSVVVLLAANMINSSAIQSEITKERVNDSTVSRGVANYISSFTFDDVDSRLTTEYVHIDRNNCSTYLSSSCTQILSPILNNYSYTTEDLFVILFRPTANSATLKSSNSLYTTVVDNAIDRFSFNSNQGNVIYFLVVNKGVKTNKYLRRGVLTEEGYDYAD